VNTNIGKAWLGQQLHSSLYLAIQRLRGRPVGEFLKLLSSWEQYDRAAYQGLVQQRLQESLSYARQHVPLYETEPWKNHLERNNPLDLSSWPVLERQVLHDYTDELVARPKVRRFIYRQSSASTAKPVRIRWDLPAIAWIWANEYRTMLWHGVGIGPKTLILWSFDDRIANLILNRRYFSTKKLTLEHLDAAARYLVEKRPSLVWGMPSAVTQLARYVGDKYPDEPRPLAQFAKVGGEQLFRFQRQEIEKYLGARPISAYGCSEMGAVAGECPRGSMHIFAPNVHVEIFKGGEPAKPGEFGDLVLTTLTNRAMPLIRYRQGDMGALSPDPCPCGLPHPLLADLKARAKDMFLTAGGRQVHGSVIGTAMEAFVGRPPLGLVRQILFQQVDQTHWKVQVEADLCNDELVSQITEVVCSTFGEACQVEIELVPYIPREPSGKYRYYRKLKSPERAVEQSIYASMTPQPE
jgi:phenylacetate-CoA ligase